MTFTPVSNISICGRLLVERRRLAMDGIALGGVDRTELVHRVADDVQHAAQRLAARREP